MVGNCGSGASKLGVMGMTALAHRNGGCGRTSPTVGMVIPELLELADGHGAGSPG